MTKTPEEIFEECKDLMHHLHGKMEELHEADPDKDHGMIAMIVFDKGKKMDALEYMDGTGNAVYNMLNHMINEDERIVRMVNKIIMDRILHTQNQDQ